MLRVVETCERRAERHADPFARIFGMQQAQAMRSMMNHVVPWPRRAMDVIP